MENPDDENPLYFLHCTKCGEFDCSKILSKIVQRNTKIIRQLKSQNVVVFYVVDVFARFDVIAAIRVRFMK